VYIPTDRESGRPRGFAFATFSAETEAAKAIELFHQKDINGRRLNVNAAEERPRGPRPTGAPGGYAGPGGPRPGTFTGAPRPYSPGGAPGGGFGGAPRPYSPTGAPRPFGAPGAGGPSRFEADRNAKSGAGPRRFNEKRRPGEDAKPAKPDDAAEAGRRAKGGGGSKRWRGDVDDY
jgi:RNA recognition motif-containing protein